MQACSEKDKAAANCWKATAKVEDTEEQLAEMEQSKQQVEEALAQLQAELQITRAVEQSSKAQLKQAQSELTDSAQQAEWRDSKLIQLESSKKEQQMLLVELKRELGQAQRDLKYTRTELESSNSNLKSVNQLQEKTLLKLQEESETDVKRLTSELAVLQLREAHSFQGTEFAAIQRAIKEEKRLRAQAEADAKYARSELATVQRVNLAQMHALKSELDECKSPHAQVAVSPQTRSRSAAADVEAVRIRKLLAVFDEFDLDRSGGIESSELLLLGKARRTLGQKKGDWTEEMNARLVKKMDVNGDGLISGAEFAEFFEQSLPTDATKFEVVIKQFMNVAQNCSAKKQQTATVSSRPWNSFNNEAPVKSPRSTARDQDNANHLFDTLDTNNDGE